MFYPQGLSPRRWLAFYAGRLPCVEVNSTFYGLPRPSTVALWRDETPQGFAFAVKAWQVITHRKRLRDCASHLETFFQRIQGFGDKLGPILFQLPPRFPFDPARLSAFIDLLPEGPDYAFEFRDPDWHRPETLALLKARRLSFCIFEFGDLQSPLWVTSGLIYVRLHGPSGPYRGSYSPKALEAWARRCLAWHGEGRRVWVFFDNDEKGYAVQNALALGALCKGAAEG